MTIRIPDALTVATSEKYNLSIRISPDGFSFSGAIPSVNGSLFYRNIPYDKSKDYISFLKETFFEEECLRWTYRNILIFCFTPAYLFVPDALYDDTKKQELMQHAYLSSVPQKMLSNTLAGEKEKLVFGIEKEMYAFLSRSFFNPRFFHHLSLPFNYWKKQSALSLSGQMYVLLNRKTIDICCFKNGEAVFVNSFSYHHADDVLYFIACTWRQVELNQLKDRLYLFGSPDYKPVLTDKLRNYIQYVSDMELPADAYLHDAEIMQASLDLILAVCE